MNKFKMTCMCGDVMEVEAADRDGAVAQLKAMMTQEAIDAHMKDKHPGAPGMSMADCHAQIDKDVIPA